MQQCTKKRFNAGYAASLNDAARTRYTEKISHIGGVDPYEEMLWDDDVRVKWPVITTVHGLRLLDSVPQSVLKRPNAELQKFRQLHILSRRQ